MARFLGFVDARDLADILDADLYRWRKGEISGEEFGAPEACCPLGRRRRSVHPPSCGMDKFFRGKTISQRVVSSIH
jgi:hypothetical protein